MSTADEPDFDILVGEFIRYILARPNGTSIDIACGEWLPEHVIGKGPIYPLAFQTYAICELVSMYELAARAGVTAAAALIFEKTPSLGREACAQLAKQMMQDAGERIRLAECDAGPAH